MLMLALIFTPTIVSAAPASQEPFTATLIFQGPDYTDRQWIDKKGIMHVKGQHQLGIITGDIEGSVEFYADLNMDMVSYNGDVKAKGVITVDGGEYKITLDGIIEAGLISGTFVINGKGDVKGIRVEGTFTVMIAANIIPLEGTMITKP